MIRALVACALVLSCGEPAAPPVEESPSSIGPMDALARRFGRLRRRMRDRGYGNAQRLQRRFVLEGQGIALPLDLPAGECTTWLALAGGGLRDLRASLYDGDGYETASDDVRGEGALLHVCPPASETNPAPSTAPYYLELRALEGSGAVVLGAFSSPVGEGDGFDELFAGVVAPPVPFREVEDALVEVRDALRERGLVALGEPIFRRLAEGQGMRRPLELAGGRCYVVVARGGEGVEDVDLYLHDARGGEVARDLGPDAHPRLEHCPDQAHAATLEARAFQGSGAVGVIVLSGEPREHEPPPPERVEGAEPLAILGTRLEELEAKGAGTPIYLVQDASLSPGETRTHEVLLGPGCAYVVGAGGPGELDLDLYLVDAEGRSVDRDARVQRTARVGVCPPEPALYRVTVKAYGRGRYALARAPVPVARDVAELRLFGVRNPEPVEMQSSRLRLTEGQRTQLPMPPARCFEAIAGGMDAVADVDLRLRDEQGELLASDTGPAPWARVEHCADGNVRASVEVLLYRGQGEVEVQWRAY
ncbi:MAG: hypothetical protein AAGE52_38910 [Myxococcota bacterium]